MDYTTDEVEEALAGMGYSAVDSDALDKIRQQICKPFYVLQNIDDR